MLNKNFPSIYFVIVKKKGDCEEDVHHLSWFSFDEKKYEGKD